MTDIDTLALDIQRALSNQAANVKGGGRVTCNHATIVRVLTEFVDAHELEMTRLRNAHDIKVNQLEHQIAQLEVRVEELNKY
jgi:TolA-binding protein